MTRRWLVALLVVCGCQSIAGIESVSHDPTLDPAAGGGAMGTGGLAGAAGVSGSSGAAGASAAAGASGTSGSSGSAGASGTSGAGGTAGASGKAGSAGIAGAAGTSGAAGKGGGAGAGGNGATAGNGGSAQGGQSGQSGQSGAGGSPPGCAVADVGDAKVRFGNFVPAFGSLDLCVKPSGAADYVGPPLSRGVGSDCPLGLLYKQLEAPRALASGTYTMKTIDGAAADCSAPAVATLDAVTLSPKTTTTLVALGGGATAMSLVALPESLPTPGDALVRFVHAAPGVPPLDAGMADGAAWPVKIIGLGYSAVPYGHILANGMSAVGPTDLHGYLSVAFPGIVVSFASALAGNATAMAFGQRSIAYGNAYSVFAVGLAGDTSFPPELTICQETQTIGRLTDCGAELDVRFEGYSTMLDGLYAGYEAERRQAAMDAVAGSDADVLCVGELERDSDKMAFADAAKATFPYSYWVAQTVASQPDDPTDIDGNVPMPYTTAPCAASVAKLGATITCMTDKCSSVPGSASGFVDDPNCLPSTCFSTIIPLAFGSFDEKRCFDCIAYETAYYRTISDIQVACSSDPGAGQAFAGQGSQLVLSRYPIDTARAGAITLPSTAWRTTVLRAPVTLPNGATVDAYCTVLTAGNRNPKTQPYTGFYGNGASANPWENEAHLQATKLLAAIQQKSGPGKVVVFGDLYVGPKYDGSLGGSPILDVAEPSFQILAGAFPIATPKDYVPACTLCGDNPLVGGAAASSTWTTHVLRGGIPATAVRSTKRTHMDLTETIQPPTGASFMAPPSSRYGLSTVLSVSP